MVKGDSIELIELGDSGCGVKFIFFFLRREK
jgi:hypothetical protein